MASIRYTQFIGIRTAENGSNGFITNSTSYSILIVYTNGAREIVEGNASVMSAYLPYLKEDNIAQILQESLSQLEQKLEKLVDTRIERIFAVNHPIPDVSGMPEDEAIARLTAAGFRVKMINSYPEGTPNGIVKAYQRENENYLTVLLDVRHELPDVRGMREDEAVALLKQAGFRITMANHYEEGTPLGKVFVCIRSGETSMDVTLDVRHDMPDVKGKTLPEAITILEAAGFVVKTSYLDPFNLGYSVVDIVRIDPRKMDVVLKVASSMLDVKGLALEEARRVVERHGIKATVIRQISKEYAAGYVCGWECENNGLVLCVSSGDDDWAVRLVKGTVTVADGTEVECRHPEATYHAKTGEMTITCDIRHGSKNKYTFSDYGNIKFDGESTFNKPGFNLYGEQIEGEKWYSVKITSRYKDFDKKKPEKATLGLYSSYGVFKKETTWKMSFEFTW